MVRARPSRRVAGSLLACVSVLAASVALTAPAGASVPAGLGPAAAPTASVITSSYPRPWDTTRSFSATVRGTSAQLRGRIAILQTRPRGTTAWTQAASKSLPLTGAVVFSIVPRRSGFHQARVVLPASSGRSAVASAAVTYRVDPVPTTPPRRAIVSVSTATLGINNPGIPGSVPPSSFAGVRFWDAGVAWRDIEKTPDGGLERFDFTRLDSLVDQAQAAGQRITYVFGQTPAFHAERPESPSYYAPGAASAPDMEAFRAFVNALMTRYGNRIEAYETWNEFNLDYMWNGTSAQMAQMTSIVYSESRKLAKPPTVLTASISPPHSYSRWYVKYVAYAKALKARSWPFDVYSLHLYTGKSDDVRYIPRLVGAFDRVVRRELGGPLRPIWNNEANLRPEFGALVPNAPDYSTTMTRSAIIKTHMLGLSAGVTRTYWYAWQTEPTSKWSVELHPGSEGTTTIARLATSWLLGVTHMSACTTSSGLTTCRLMTYNAVTKAYATRGYVAWSETSKIVKIVVPITVGSVQRIDGTALTRVSGSYYVGSEPVLVLPPPA